MNVSTTFIVETLDRKNLPVQMLMVFIKNLFIYGRTGLLISGDQIHLTLSYCPKRDTVEKKLRGLPVKWMRVFVDTEEEFKLLCKGMQRFKDVTLSIDDDETTSINISKIEPQQQQQSNSISPTTAKKRKTIVQLQSQSTTTTTPPPTITTPSQKSSGDLPLLEEDDLNFEDI